MKHATSHFLRKKHNNSFFIRYFHTPVCAMVDGRYQEAGRSRDRPSRGRGMEMVPSRRSPPKSSMLSGLAATMKGKAASIQEDAKGKVCRHRFYCIVAFTKYRTRMCLVSCRALDQLYSCSCLFCMIAQQQRFALQKAMFGASDMLRELCSTLGWKMPVVVGMKKLNCVYTCVLSKGFTLWGHVGRQ